jgi:hypothetical protein
MKAKLFACLLSLFLYAGWASANNMLIQNVTTTGNNAAAKTIQVQFDISWDNSWRDGINWDAAWVFIKFKDANGLWQHAQLNQTGFANGSGTANIVKVTSDKVGCWAYRSALGSGTFNATGMQLQWNYGLSGLNDVTGLEVRVFSTEMVYVPEGEFNCAKIFHNSAAYNSARTFYAPKDNFPVINSSLSPILNYNNGSLLSIKIKGDAGLDTDFDGIVDKTLYPTGFTPFYSFKYELSEQQFADFLNTLTSNQISTIGVPVSSIFKNNNSYNVSSPNKALGNSNAMRVLSYADWSGLRPMSFLEFNKASYGPEQPLLVCPGCFAICGYPANRGTCCFNDGGQGFTLIDVGSFANSTSTRDQSSSSYYGILDLTGNAHEPVVKLSAFSFSKINGDGNLSPNGSNNVNNWTVDMLDYVDMLRNENAFCGSGGPQWNWFSDSKYGFRYVRSAE